MWSHLKSFWEKFSGVEQKLLLFFILVIIISSFTLRYQHRANATSVPDAGGNYVEGLLGQPQRINPLLAPSNDVDMDLSRIIYSGLYKFDPDLNIMPDLAVDLPEISPDGKEYTIRLKDNLSWHDGEPLTADDVVFTLQAIQNSEYLSPLRFSWNKVTVEKIDAQTVKLTTKEATSPFIANLTVGILPKHIWGNVPAENFALSQFNLEPVGSGPFQVKELERGRDGEIKSLTLDPFKNYHGEGPYLDEITFRFYKNTDELIRAYQARDIDGLGYVPFDQRLFIKPGKRFQQYELPLPQYQAVFINRAKNPAPLEDANVRTALAKSVDKKRIIDEVYNSQASEAYGPILPQQLGYHPNIPGADMNIYDVEAAKALLEESGWTVDPETGFRKDSEGRFLFLELATNTFTPNVKVAELLKQMWEAVGIQIGLRVETVADLESNLIRPREYQLLLFSENVGADPDPFPFWHSSQLRDPGLNLSTFNNPTADKLLVEARGNLAADQRAERYQKFQEIFVGDVPAIFVTQSLYIYNLPADLKGVNLHSVVTPATRFANINQWYIETKLVKQ